jgi:mannose-6-phosphate isomerase-like protein (cupin superfamily)
VVRLAQALGVSAAALIDGSTNPAPRIRVLRRGEGAAHGTIEHMHVAAGTVRVTVGDETADLAAGDSCSCRTDAPHGVENPHPSTEALIYLIVERG